MLRIVLLVLHKNNLTIDDFSGGGSECSLMPLTPLTPLLAFLSHKRNPCAERISCFTLDNAGYNIRSIVPTVGVKGATICGEVGV